MRGSRCFGLVVGLVLMSGQAGIAADPISEFLRVVPGDANAVVIVRVNNLVDSPRGRREGWADKSRDAFLGGAEQIPPWVTIACRACRLRPEESSTVWSIGVVGLPQPIPLDRVAEHEHSTIEVIADTPCVRNVRGGYFTSIAPDVLAVYAPAYRQDFARWARYVQSNGKSQMGSYLQNAVVHNSSSILLAIDLQDTFSPALVMNWIKHSHAITNKEATGQSLATLFAGLKGVRFEATVEDETRGTMSLDFSTPVGDHGPAVKALLLEFLEQSGAIIDDLVPATVSARGSTVTLSMNVSDDGLRRVLSLIASPNPMSRATSATARAESHSPAETGSLELTQKYYLAVNKLVDDLALRHARAKNYEKTATWHETFARKIDQLPINGVNPELVKYATEAASRMRALAASLRGVQLEVKTIQNTLTYEARVDPGYGAVSVWGGFGYRPATWEVNSNLQTVRERQAEAVTQGANDREQIWARIGEDRQAIRVRMQQIFGVDLEAKR